MRNNLLNYFKAFGLAYDDHYQLVSQSRMLVTYHVNLIGASKSGGAVYFDAVNSQFYGRM